MPVNPLENKPVKNCTNLLDSVRIQRLNSETVKRKTFQAGEVIEMLKKKQGDRTLRQFAIDLGISVAYLHDIYHGNRYPGDKILSQLGLVKAVPPEPMYETA